MSRTFVVIGLGSMGKRRIRCLQALGMTAIVGVDPREDRCAEAAARYQVPVHASLDAAAVSGPQAWIISVPPDLHHVYLERAASAGIPSFVEASVVDTGMASLLAREEAGALIAPSATLCFHPAIRQIRDIVAGGRLGRLSSVSMHSGQYLPDWHTYEAVSDYYVSNRDTGGAREIVPFELTWLVTVFDWPRTVSAQVRKTIEIPGAETIDDTYALMLDMGAFPLQLTVDVVSRVATRRLLVNGETGQLVWDWNEGCIRLYDAATAEWSKIEYDLGKAEAGYNANIGEQMYIDEIRAFCDAVDGLAPFPNALGDDHRILGVLYAAERASANRSVEVLPS
ncbi:putative dehydrogenase [Fluviicoccus keumensis]|uniref:Putative dehydrogenase n=1 Tax=Fluviicoccus keumensis TaxID=1435465 RepID=A0A4Q7ZAV8_9GAMM|nr:Gfo/Idh/MocA family oxidoreductase [Fluviicoccus keumensis]RZU47274.1 putative dehydrogenase [Fluviicoccus keumensis]